MVTSSLVALHITRGTDHSPNFEAGRDAGKGLGNLGKLWALSAPFLGPFLVEELKQHCTASTIGNLPGFCAFLSPCVNFV